MRKEFQFRIRNEMFTSKNKNRAEQTMKGKLLLSMLFAALSVTACYNIGPKTIPRDRFDYNAAISDSWKEQTLLNIVKLRYADMPLFVDISSVVSGYTLESQVNVFGSRSSTDAVQGNSATVGGSATFTDRPTITYAPITGSQFNKSFMTPIPPRSVLFLLQSGWSADMIFPLTVDSINGLRSQISAGSRARSGDDDYYRVVELIRRMQLDGATGMQLQRDELSNETALLIIHKSALDEDGKAAFTEFDSLLGLRPDLQEIGVRYGYLPENDAEITMITYSMLQIIIKLATQIEVPPEHAADGRTVPSMQFGEEVGRQQLVRITSSKEEPEDAFVAVRYRDHWYSIDDRDFKSKSVFTFVMILFSLTESGDNANLPVITIPTG
jgi:hypothetical protein